MNNYKLFKRLRDIIVESFCCNDTHISGHSFPADEPDCTFAANTEQEQKTRNAVG